jgi:hypothetical protein
MLAFRAHFIQHFKDATQFLPQQSIWMDVFASISAGFIYGGVRLSGHFGYHQPSGDSMQPADV